MNTSGVRVDSSEVTKLLAEGSEKARSMFTSSSGVPWAIHQYVKLQADAMFRVLRQGGTFRGETWAYFSNQYTRKTDGMVVPAWGGVPKLRGKGVVKGRLRPSGARAKPGDAIMQDTMNLRGKAASSMSVSPNQITIGSPVKYAPHQARRRPWLFWNLPDDLVKLQGIIIDFLSR